MKAILSRKYGTPEVFCYSEVIKPVPKSDEILIRVFATTVTAADIMMRKGTPLIGRVYLGLWKPKKTYWDLILPAKLWKLEKMFPHLRSATKFLEEQLHLDVTLSMYV